MVVVLAVLLVAVDIGARAFAQRQLEQRIDRSVEGARSRVTVSGFPFLGKLVARGRVDRITAHLAHAGQGAFVLDQVDITVTGAAINRRQAIEHRQLQIDRIDTGTVVAGMNQADFDRLVGLPIVLDQGAAHTTVAGVRVTARVSIVNNHLQVSVVGVPVSIPVPSLPVLPCAADVHIVPGRLIASCTFRQIPPAFRIVSP